jgi:CheY-like chemotaxis protein
MNSAQHSNPGASEQAATRAHTRGRVLVVEDDPEAAEFFRHALTVRGRFQVTHTADPADALALAAAAAWDLVVTDLNLPGMSGTDLLRALRPIAPRLPAILVTADPLSISCLGGADALLSKPVQVDTFLATVVALVAGGGKAAADR